LKLDPLLLGPTHVVRPKQPLNLDRELHPGAWVGRQQFIVDRDVQHTAKHPQFLMDCRRLKPIFFNNAGGGRDLNPSLKPPSKIVLNVICGKLSDRSLAECLFEAPAGALVRFVGLFRADRRLGVVLQEKVHPIRKLQLFSFPDDIEDSVVPGLEAIPQFPLGLLPVFRVR
jgi:hypothetical protein